MNCFAMIPFRSHTMSDCTDPSKILFPIKDIQVSKDVNSR